MPIALLVVTLLLTAIPAEAVVYLCPTDGTGVEGDYFRSRALSEMLPGRGNVDLRDDVSKPGMMLCESDSLPTDMTGVVVIGATRRASVSAQAKSDVGTAAKRTIRGATTEDVIRELVIPRLPRPKTGTYEIRLGKSTITEVASFHNDVYYKGLMVALKEWSGEVIAAVVRPVEAWAERAFAIETFNCSDASVLDCVHNWTNKVGTTIDIVSNRASLSGNTDGVDYVASSLDTTDQEVRATVVAATTGGGGTSTTCSVVGRTTADATQTYYRVLVTIRNSGELNDVSLVKTIAGSTTTLDTDTTDWVANDQLSLRMVLTTITGRKNGSEILAATDSDITTGQYVGLRYFSDSASGNCKWDNWEAFDIPARIRGGSRWFP